MKDEAFIGAKVALFIGDQLLVILRDEDRDIPWPGHWDFPGGGREDGETPEEVVIRETFEEVGLQLYPENLLGKRDYETSSGHRTYFFACHLPAGSEAGIVFGNEGQRWELWSVGAYLSHPKAVPQFKVRLGNYLGSSEHHIL
ncbi:MAG: NUDIX hydrolase [Pseudomonadota bacterium]